MENRYSGNTGVDPGDIEGEVWNVGGGGSSRCGKGKVWKSGVDPVDIVYEGRYEIQVWIPSTCRYCRGKDRNSGMGPVDIL
jgi:hypothetical protein